MQPTKREFLEGHYHAWLHKPMDMSSVIGIFFDTSIEIFDEITKTYCASTGEIILNGFSPWFFVRRFVVRNYLNAKLGFRAQHAAP